MKTALYSIVILTLTSSAFAAKSYQVTGPVMNVTADTITVQKGKESWEIMRSASTKAPADIKKGDKVTVYYTMSATEIESKKK